MIRSFGQNDRERYLARSGAPCNTGWRAQALRSSAVGIDNSNGARRFWTLPPRFWIERPRTLREEILGLPLGLTDHMDNSLCTASGGLSIANWIPDDHSWQTSFSSLLVAGKHPRALPAAGEYTSFATKCRLSHVALVPNTMVSFVLWAQHSGNSVSRDEHATLARRQ